MNARRPSPAFLLFLSLGACGPAETTSVTKAAATVDERGSVMAGDALRSGWYPDQPGLDPVTVSSPYFGRIFDTVVEGQVYAQPLYAAGVLLVATEANRVYALDPATGAPRWQRELGAPWRAADMNCNDLKPTIGVTGTPAIDAATGTAYLLSKTYENGSDGTAVWLAHALDLGTGDERPGFPVAITGTASNDPTQTFNPTRHMQRPGLLLMDGVVYAAFSGHCDMRPYSGWVVGISTEGAVKTLWTAESGSGRSDGAGIWQSGGALISDGKGQILFATGNDWAGLTSPVPGRQPPGALGEAVVRLAVMDDGSLSTMDFFSPADRDALNRGDNDLGSGAPVGLPPTFATNTRPHLMVHAGKSGYLYLLDRDDLGGYLQGPGGADRVVQRVGPFGGVWSKPSAWPGDGGWVYVPVVNQCASPTDTAGCLRGYQFGTTADGEPALSLGATSTNTFGYGTSAVVVTSDGTRSGSALLWTTWSSGWNGTASQLRAYDALPDNGAFRLRFLAGIGTSAKFTAPAVGDGRVYVGTRDGHIMGFGLATAPPLRAQGLAFAPTTVGEALTSSVILTADAATNVLGLALSGDFAVAEGAPALPLSVEAGAAFELPVAFRPALAGPALGTLEVTTDRGTFTIPLTGVGQASASSLVVDPPVVSFAPTVMGRVARQTITLTNTGASAVTISGVSSPAAPFAVTGLPAVGTTLAAGEYLALTIRFAPSAVGSSAAYLSVEAGGALAVVAVEGSALGGGRLRIAPTALDAGPVAVGQTATMSVRLFNEGDADVIVQGSTPPSSPVFQAQGTLEAGTVIAPGASLEHAFLIAPTTLGPASDVWQLETDDGRGPRLVTMTVTGVEPPQATLAAPTSPTALSDEAPPLSGGCSAAGGAAPPASLLALLLMAGMAVLARTRAHLTGDVPIRARTARPAPPSPCGLGPRAVAPSARPVAPGRRSRR